MAVLRAFAEGLGVGERKEGMRTALSCNDR